MHGKAPIFKALFYSQDNFLQMILKLSPIHRGKIEAKDITKVTLAFVTLNFLKVTKLLVVSVWILARK